MFTGLIQAVGTVHLRGKGVVIAGCDAFSPLSLGDSISVDGVCLTVSDLVPHGFVADVSEETLTRTTLGTKAAHGDHVNLEPALRFSDRIGGHLVSGHVDGLGEIFGIDQLKKSWEIKVKWKENRLGRYLCEKASVALNGISLTISSIDDEIEAFTVAVIPHTWENTSLRFMEVGTLINLEVDLMAKYAERLLIQNSNMDSLEKSNKNPTVSSEWLNSHGWQ